MIEIAAAVDSLQALMQVEEVGTNLFRGGCAPGVRGRVFGGQVVAQALAAATGTVGAERLAHSLHAYFLRAGDPSRPIDYQVFPDFDGGSFANRRAIAMQDGIPILNLAASFHVRKSGFSHTTAMPRIPAAEDCPDVHVALTASGTQYAQAVLERLAAFEVRMGSPGLDASGLPSRFIWFRSAAPITLSAAESRVMLAYASDFALLSTAVIPHAQSIFPLDVQLASIDHALWFHSTPDLNDWLLYAMDSPWAGESRGFARGSFYDRSGKLIASAAQEGLCRPLPPAK